MFNCFIKGFDKIEISSEDISLSPLVFVFLEFVLDRIGVCNHLRCRCVLLWEEELDFFFFIAVRDAGWDVGDKRKDLGASKRCKKYT